MTGFGGGNVVGLGHDAIKADRVKWLVAVVEAEFRDNFRVLRDDPKVIIESTDIAATAGIEERAELDRVGETEIPGNVREAHINVQRHGWWARRVRGARGKAADGDREMLDSGLGGR